MSSSKRATLNVVAEPGVTITVLNDDLTSVASGIGQLSERLPLGLYDVQLIAGHGLSSHVVRLDASGTTLAAAPVDFPSPAPLSPTAADDVVAHHAHRISRRPQRRLGKGAQLLLVVADDSPAARANAAAQLTLRTPKGEPVVDFEQLTTRSKPGQHPLWAITCLELNPGPYLLRINTGRTTLEQTVFLVKDWQTQVFLDRKSFGPSPARRRASLPDAAVLMAPTDVGFDPNSPDLRLTELARVALLDQRTVLNADEISSLLNGKWNNPLLGLYGANVVLATRARSISELGVVRQNLRRLLGDHPDVTALDARAGEAHDPVLLPPMLRVSWDALVAATAERPQLIPTDSLNAAISSRLYGTGVWLTWERPRPQAKKTPVPTSSLGNLGEAINELIAAISSRTQTTLSPKAESATAIGESILALASEFARQAVSGSTAAAPSEGELIERLGAPQTVIAAALADTLRTLR